jgi:hypothetical protein
METTDELVKETIKALPLDQQQQILDVAYFFLSSTQYTNFFHFS